MAKLLCLEGLEAGLSLELSGEEIGLGRGSMNTIVLPHPSVSREHAVIKREEGQWILTDLQSSNGTSVNDQRVSSSILEHDDVVVFGDLVFRFDSRPAVSNVPPLAETSPEVKLICQEGMEKGFEIKIEGNTCQIGRDESSQVRLIHKSISRKHCEFSISARQVLLRDLGSTNGCFVNGELVQEREVVHSDDIKLGALRFVISIVEPDIKTQLPRDSSDSQVTVSKITNEEFASLDASVIEGALIQAELQSSVVSEIEGKSVLKDLPEIPFLDKILLIERERQQLLLLYEISKACLSIVKKSDFQQSLPSLVSRLFQYKSMFLALGNEFDHELLVQEGDCLSSDLTEIFSVSASEGERVVYRQKAEGKNTMVIGPIGLDNQQRGVFHMETEGSLTDHDQQIFEMFLELLSPSISKVLHLEG